VVLSFGQGDQASDFVWRLPGVEARSRARVLLASRAHAERRRSI